MKRSKVLNSKELKHLFSIIARQWGDFDSDLVFVLKDEVDLFVLTKETAVFNVSELKTYKAGLFFGTFKDDEVKLSIEGSQIVGPFAKKNVVELSQEESRLWLRGFDLDKKVDAKGYVIIRYGADFMGCGKLVGGKIINLVPRIRRLKSSD